MDDGIKIKLQNFFKTQPIEKAWLFGSYSRNEETDKSDIDILVRYSSDYRPGLFGICRLIDRLENLVGKKIDLVEEGTLYPRVFQQVEREKIIIYERKN